MQCALRWRSEREKASDDKGSASGLTARARRGGHAHTRHAHTRLAAADALNTRVSQDNPPTQRDHKPHPIYADASGAAAALASALRFALARALDLRASACSVKAFSRAFSPLSLWIASMSTRLFLYWLPFAAM